MFRVTTIALLIMSAMISCARFEQRSARYNETECPICQAKNNGVCTYCNGTKECMFCKGLKERTTVIPNRTAPGIKQGSYSTPCPFCNNTGACTYCEGTGKCWACQGSGKVSTDWQFLNKKTMASAEKK